LIGIDSGNYLGGGKKKFNTDTTLEDLIRLVLPSEALFYSFIVMMERRLSLCKASTPESESRPTGLPKDTLEPLFE